MIGDVHPSAVVSEEATLGDGVVIGPCAVIEAGAAIGAGCRIGAHAVIKRHVRMGRGNIVHEHAVLGGDPQDHAFAGAASFVEIGVDNVLREGVTVHRSSRAGGTTRIGDGNMLMAYTHVAHDCQLGNRIIMANGAGISGHVAVSDNAFISGLVGVHQYCRIGRYAMVSGLAKVSQDCLPFIVTDGNPARARGLNLVGLRRGGFVREEIEDLKRAYRVLFKAGLTLQAALEALAESPAPLVRELVQFIRGSKRGFAHDRTH